MFSKLPTIKKFSKEVISIDDLVNIVISGESHLINKIRSVEYKSKEYNNLKLKVSAIAPHGIFTTLRKESLVKLSGYLYFDIDGLDNPNDTKQKLIDTNMVTFICNSVGGKGLSFLIKINESFDLNDTNFIQVYEYVRYLLINKGFDIDKSAGGLTRKMIISSDIHLYYNDKVSLGIDMVPFGVWNDLNKIKQSSKIQRTKRDSNINPNGPLILLPFSELITQIKTETIYNKEVVNNYEVDDIEYYKIFIPRVIKDKTKHKLYTRIVNALYYLNPNINRNQVYSFIHFVNRKALPQMNNQKMESLVNFLCDSIESTGEVKIQTRIKKIHFNNKMKLTAKEKMSIGAKIGGMIRTNKTIKLIDDARMECAKLNLIPTQIKISELTGIPLSTIKRNWNKEISDINIYNKEKIVRKEKLFETLNEEVYFNNELFKDVLNDDTKKDELVIIEEKKVSQNEDFEAWCIKSDMTKLQNKVERNIDGDFGEADINGMEDLFESF